MNERTEESWLPVVGYEGFYEVSSLGRVRSLDRLVHNGPGCSHTQPGRVMAIHRRDHYSKVRLKVDGSGRTFNVHALVAAAFMGPRPDGMEVCHNNGDHHDNRAENLRYDTHSANALDIVAHGRHQLAERTQCSRGHEFTADTTMPREGGKGRRCLICEGERSKRRWREELARRAGAA